MHAVLNKNWCGEIRFFCPAITHTSKTTRRFCGGLAALGTLLLLLLPLLCCFSCSTLPGVFFFFDARMIASKLRLLVVCCCSYFPGFFAINRDLDYIPREPAGDHAIYQNCCLQFVVRFVLCRLRKAEITWCFPGKHVYACFNESLMGVNTNSY